MKAQNHPSSSQHMYSPTLQNIPFSETYGANSARQDPRQGRQLLWPATVIPMFWLPCNIYFHDLICKSRWGYRAGQSRWNSTLWPPGGISPHVMTESRKKSYSVRFSKMLKLRSKLANKNVKWKMFLCITNSSTVRQWVQWDRSGCPCWEAVEDRSWNT